MKNLTTKFGYALAFAIIATMLAFLLILPMTGHTSERTTVMELDSAPGESKTDFLIRVGVFMYGWSASTGDEACGLISQQDDRYSVIVQTLRSQVMCDSDAWFVGYTLTGETIHSHPVTDADGIIVLTERTKELAGRALRGRDRIKAKRLDFSTSDYAIGPGYLVDNGLLLYQAGIGTSVIVAHLPNEVAVR